MMRDPNINGRHITTTTKWMRNKIATFFSNFLYANVQAYLNVEYMRNVYLVSTSQCKSDSHHRVTIQVYILKLICPSNKYWQHAKYYFGTWKTPSSDCSLVSCSTLSFVRYGNFQSIHMHGAYILFHSFSRLAHELTFIPRLVWVNAESCNVCDVFLSTNKKIIDKKINFLSIEIYWLCINKLNAQVCWELKHWLHN